MGFSDHQLTVIGLILTLGFGIIQTVLAIIQTGLAIYFEPAKAQSAALSTSAIGRRVGKAITQRVSKTIAQIATFIVLCAIFGTVTHKIFEQIDQITAIVTLLYTAYLSTMISLPLGNKFGLTEKGILSGTIAVLEVEIDFLNTPLNTIEEIVILAWFYGTGFSVKLIGDWWLEYMYRSVTRSQQRIVQVCFCKSDG